MKKVFILVALFAGLAVPAFSQNSFYSDHALRYNTGFPAYPASGAVITVCQFSAIGLPCIPLAPVCSGPADLVCTAPNPFNADANGNFGFWAPPGLYTVTITGANLNGYTLVVSQNVPINGLATNATNLIGPGNINGTFGGAASFQNTGLSQTSYFGSVTNPANFSPWFFRARGSNNPGSPGPNGAVAGSISDILCDDVTITSGCVGQYSGAIRSAGTGGTWGANPLVDCRVTITLTNPCYGIEIDMNNSVTLGSGTAPSIGAIILAGAGPTGFKSYAGWQVGLGGCPLSCAPNWVYGGIVIGADNGLLIQGSLTSAIFQTPTSATGLANSYPAPVNFVSSVWNGAAPVNDILGFAPSGPSSGTPTFLNYIWSHSGGTGSPAITLGPQSPVRFGLFGTNATAVVFALDNAAPASSSVITVPSTVNATMVLDSATQTLSSKTLTSPIINGVTNGTGFQLFNTATTCTTAGSVGATCTTAAISLPVTEPDTSYFVVCTGKGPTNVPVVTNTTNSSTSQFTITIAALTAAAASFSSYDCHVGHN